MDGGFGNDRMHGGTGADTMKGDLGNDTLNGNDGDDSMNGGLGNDTMNGGAGADNMRGEFGDDVMTGGSGNDTMRGGDGDRLNGGNDNDTIFTDSASQVLVDNDIAHGDAGNDTISSFTGIDQLFGDAGNDTFIVRDFGRVSFGAVTVNGGTGTDKVTLNNLILPAFDLGDAVPVWNKFTGIERLDIETDSGNQTLAFTFRNVINMSDTDVLTIDGDVGDTVSLLNIVTGDIFSNGLWQQAADQVIGGETFRVFNYDAFGPTGTVATVRIDSDIGTIVLEARRSACDGSGVTPGARGARHGHSLFGFGNLLQAFHIENQDAIAFGTDEFAVLERPEMAAGVLAREAEIVSEVALRHREVNEDAVLAFAAVLVGEPQEARGTTPRHRQQAFLRHRRGRTQLRAELLDDREHGLWVRGQHRAQVIAMQLKRLGRLDRDGVRRAWLAVERCDLSRDITGSEKIEHDLARIDRGVRDLDPPFDEDHQAVAGVASPVNRLAGGDVDHAAALDELRKRGLRKFAEERQGFEEGVAWFFQGRHGQPLTRCGEHSPPLGRDRVPGRKMVLQHRHAHSGSCSRRLGLEKCPRAKFASCWFPGASRGGKREHG